MARGRAGKRKWLVPHQRALERQHDECTTREAIAAAFCPCTNRRTDRQTGCNRSEVEWPPIEGRKELAAAGGCCEGRCRASTEQRSICLGEKNDATCRRVRFPPRQAHASRMNPWTMTVSHRVKETQDRREAGCDRCRASVSEQYQRPP